MMGCHGQETSLMASGRWLPYVDKIPCDGPIGVCARRLTAERSPRTKMLRALKTLQPENDTRRLCPVSMNREGPCRDFMRGRGRFGVLPGESPGRILRRCGTFHTIGSALGRQYDQQGFLRDSRTASHLAFELVFRPPHL